MAPVHTIMDEIQQSLFLVATYGSSGMDSMLFGWEITTKTGNPLALHAILAFGSSSSFQSEAYGVFVIIRICQQQSYPYDHSFHTLNPDWDAIAQIVSIINKSNLYAELRHVKGCQDKNKMYEELSFPAQLNIDVDAQAVEFCSSYR
eukprot:8677413-Ditylum_brightwellii.AAC.1